ncbi:MAG TPA: hypothetical protein VMT34_07535, partial [Aggregatilineales bacterium]|nr:hypothetical protein [Aggregatilineales bacterium]
MHEVVEDAPDFDFHDEDSPIRAPYLSRWIAVAICLAAAAVLFLWASETPPGALGKADAIAYAICHRIAERTFM